MGIKSKERECLDRIIKFKNVTGKFATNIHNILVQCKDDVTDSERPDFIIKSEDITIGIEHCMVDVLFKVKKHSAQSLIREQENISKRKIDEYKKSSETFDEEIKNGKSMEFVIGMLEERFKRRKNFQYSVFIDNFQTICNNHNDKCDIYRKNISPNKKQSFLACIVEIPYPSTTSYLITDTQYHERVQAVKGFPITNDILNIIENMDNFDIVIICMYCYDSPNNRKNTNVLYFVPKNIQQGIKQQYIKPFIKFDYPMKDNVTLSYERIDNGYTLFANITSSY